MDPLKSITSIAASGMHAQGQRLRIVAENVANADSRGTTPGADPYRRKTVSFEEMIDRESGAALVKVGEIGRDTTDFTLVHDPAHPAADENGFVKVPNVNAIIEMTNMREAARSYEANMNMYEAGRAMRQQILDLLK
ncbi:flagellar basal body rod protein [Oceanicola granulosus HTCC2516]|uniref:Flagellar basal-body rod protein FlgC n=1 Tax=Oceanicola granulosus (strain ATCC BAA-861 / DSM 15982 / KCTC 12143 / HTCC2516) TaxID=314256 RepID=Q2CGJ1_OCEGH|nr:flagellar basal body rod protein FlgC [Oceanicola granulosus]EAR51727.1 flagellar basal body rod protein [Oceanicola granulosus HTCC2516]